MKFTTRQRTALAALLNMADDVRDTGLNVVCCVFSYDSDGRCHSATRIMVEGPPELGLSASDVFLDALLEILDGQRADRFLSRMVPAPDKGHEISDAVAAFEP